MSEWIVILGAGAVTFLTRASFIVFADPQKFPHAFRVALAYVPAAVLAAIVVPGLAIAHGALDWGPIAQVRRSHPAVSAERTSSSTVRRVGQEGREAERPSEVAA